MMHDRCDLLRLRPEHRRPRDDDLFAHAQQQIRVHRQQRVDQIEMFYDYAPAALDRFHDRVRQHVRLRKARFKANVQMIGVRRVEARFAVHVQNRQRAHVHAVIIVRKLQPRKHAEHQRALAGARFADEADQMIIGT